MLKSPFLFIINFFANLILCSISYYIRFKSGLFEIEKFPPVLWQYAILAVFISLITSAYITRKGLKFPKGVGEQVFVGASLGFFSAIILTFFIKPDAFSRIFLLLLYPLQIIGLSVLNLKFKHYLFSRKKPRCALVGSTDLSPLVFERLKQKDASLNLVGIITFDAVPPDPRFLGNATDFKEITGKWDIKEILIIYPPSSKDDLEKMLDDCQALKISYQLIPDSISIFLAHGQPYQSRGVAMLRVEPRLDATGIFLKRCMDIIGSSFGIIIFAPFMIVISLLVWITSGLPVLFRQERAGLDEKTFTIYKFRTMIKDAEKEGPVWSTKDDERQTFIGRFLRKTSLDELPQFFNVLKADMSLVGPRPEQPYFIEKFKKSIPRYIYRHMIKSGMTGWAQVNGLRGNTSIEERVRYDIYYIENWSVLFDLKIIIRTVWQMLK